MDIATRIALLKLALGWLQPVTHGRLSSDWNDGKESARELCAREVLELLGIDWFGTNEQLSAELARLEAQRVAMAGFLGAEGTQLDIC